MNEKIYSIKDVKHGQWYEDIGGDLMMFNMFKDIVYIFISKSDLLISGRIAEHYNTIELGIIPVNVSLVVEKTHQHKD